MDKHFKCVALLLIISIFSSFSSPREDEKAELLKILLMQVDDYLDIKLILPILKKKPSLFRFVPSVHPIKENDKPRISSHFGKRKDPVTGEQAFHKGIDFACEFATVIYATADGSVIEAQEKGGYGNCIFIGHDFGFYTKYAHLTEFYCKKGDEVKKGQPIGFLGSTGKSTGNHLHYEIIKNEKNINPINFLQL